MMNTGPAASPAAIPLTSLILGYGPILPLVAAASASWALPAPWPDLALRLALIWGALILSFVGGVRRGFGIGNPAASTSHAIVAM